MVNTANKGNELLKQLEEAFAAMKKELGFLATLDELDDVFYIRDFIMKERFVSMKFSRMLNGRISETYLSWAAHLQSLMVPNPNSIINNRIMAFVSANTPNGLTKEKAARVLEKV